MNYLTRKTRKGGENRESNLRTLLMKHHATKTKADVAEKAMVYRKRSKHLGIRQSSRPMPGSRASNIKMKIGGGWEYRR